MKARDYKGPSSDGDGDGAPILPVAHALRGEGFDASEDGTGRGTPIVPVAYPIAIQERAVSENPDAGPDGKGWRDDGAAYTLEARSVTQAVAVDSAFTFNTTQLTSPQSGQDLGPDKPCHSLAAKDHPPAVAFQTRREVAGALTSNYGKQPDSSDTGLGPNLIAFTAKDHGGDAVENISPTLRAGGHTGSHANAGVMPAVAFDMRGREGGAMPEGPHDTANIRAASGGSSPSYAASQAWGVRRLTPTECARLQGFPDDWARIPWRGKPADECPDGPQYKAYGNSMAVPVMEWIGERIEAIRAATGGHE